MKGLRLVRQIVLRDRLEVSEQEQAKLLPELSVLFIPRKQHPRELKGEQLLPGQGPKHVQKAVAGLDISEKQLQRLQVDAVGDQVVGVVRLVWDGLDDVLE